MNKESVFNVLSAINVNDKIEKKNGLNYLPWAWAWAEVKKRYETANYEVTKFDGKPYLFDADLGYLVETKVTINNETIPMQLFVMDGANKAQKNVTYQYEVADMKWDDQQRKKVKVGVIVKQVEAATMFDINTTIMRCLTKNLAMFGLGHYIYAGEDLPPQNDEPKKEINITELGDLLSKCKTKAELKTIYEKDERHKEEKIKSLFTAHIARIENETKNS